MILNLDSTFDIASNLPKANLIKYKHFTFPAGEPHIQILNLDQLSSTDSVTIIHRLRCFQDIGLLLMACDVLRSLGIEVLHLYLPYFPASRQDRRIKKGEPLSVKVYADLINSVGFTSVKILDPHSDVTTAFLNRVELIDIKGFLQQVITKIELDQDLDIRQFIWVVVDAGVRKKIESYLSLLGLEDVVILQCLKSRNKDSGKLMSIEVLDKGIDLQGKPCLLLDDICDGGATFLALAKALESYGVGELYLAVTHGIFSKGFEALSSYYKHIFTTDSFHTFEVLPSCVSQIEIASFVEI